MLRWTLTKTVQAVQVSFVCLQEASDERLRKIEETLQGIKLIKLYSWEDEFCKRILKVRAHELKLLDKDSLYWALISKF